MNAPIFRPEAVASQQSRWLGELILIYPLRLRWLGVGAGIAAIVVVTFVTLGSYTRRSTVQGILSPTSGIVKVHSTLPGIVQAIHVTEGQAVKKGQELFVISSERRTIAERQIQAGISRRVTERHQSLIEEITSTKQIQADEIKSSQTKIRNYEIGLSNLTLQLSDQQTRLRLANAAYQRMKTLSDQGYVSIEMVQQKSSEILEQRARLLTLNQSMKNLQDEIDTHRLDALSLPLRHANQIAQLRRQVSAVDQELMESESRRELLIVAPTDGIITAITAHTGQSVDMTGALTTIVPTHAALQAELYAPSQAIGFVRVNDEVLIRFNSYPYQKFGHGHGRVISISRTSLSQQDMSPPTLNISPSSGNLYLIAVELSDKTIEAYGETKKLQPGMSLEADILLENRRIYEWIFEPLLTLSKKL